MMTLNELFNQYKQLTDCMLEIVDDIDEVQVLISEREKLINKINEIKYDKDDLKEIVQKLNLIESEDKLLKKIKEEKSKTKQALDNVQKLKRAQEIYNREEGIPVYFNLQSY